MEIEDLTKSFGPRVLWSELRFTVQPRQMLALAGASGSGKSTLLNCLGLLDVPTSGRITYEGRDITSLRRTGRRRFRRDVLGYLFQNYALVENATVADNLAIAVKPKPRGTGTPTPSEALERVGLTGRETNVFTGSAAANNNVWLSPACLSRNPHSSWPTSPPARSTITTRPWSSIHSAR